jgi:hypothetical protein
MTGARPLGPHDARCRAKAAGSTVETTSLRHIDDDEYKPVWPTRDRFLPAAQRGD